MKLPLFFCECCTKEAEKQKSRLEMLRQEKDKKTPGACPAGSFEPGRQVSGDSSDVFLRVVLF